MLCAQLDEKYECKGKTKQFKKDSLPLEAIMYIEKHAMKETEKQYVLSAESVNNGSNVIEVPVF